MTGPPEARLITTKTKGLVAKLHKKKFRKVLGLYLAEGFKTLHDSLRLGAKARFFILRRDKDRPSWLADAPVYMASETEFDHLSAQETPSGILGVLEIPKPCLISEWIRGSRLLILDSLADPGNVGTLLRAAHWFGFRHVALTGTPVDVYNPKVVQAAMGSLAALNIIFPERTNLIKALSESSTQVFVTALEPDDFSPSAYKPNASVALVLGSEAHGLDAAWFHPPFYRVYIPSGDPHPPDSLNVALAGAILMRELSLAKKVEL